VAEANAGKLKGEAKTANLSPTLAHAANLFRYCEKQVIAAQISKL
jgi:hypothetical protein